jgi:hypothetical protein
VDKIDYQVYIGFSQNISFFVSAEAGLDFLFNSSHELFRRNGSAKTRGNYFLSNFFLYGISFDSLLYYFN